MSTRATGSGTPSRKTKATSVEKEGERKLNTKGKEKGDESEGEEENETLETPKKRGRPKGSQNKTRTRSRSRTSQRSGSQTPVRRTRKEEKEKKEETKEGKGDERMTIKEAGEEKGKAIKQEMMDQPTKVQQTLGFPVIPTTVDLTGIGETSISLEKPIEIESGKEDGIAQNKATPKKTRTPKRKQDEIMKGIEKRSDGNPKRKPRTSDELEQVRRRMETMGRGNAMGRGRGNLYGRGGGKVVSPPKKNNMARVNKTFEPLATTEGRTTEKMDVEVVTPIKKGRKTPEKEAGMNQTNIRVNREEDRSPRIENPYKTRGRPAREDDPRGKSPVTYATVTMSPQAKIQTHTKLKEAHESYMEVTFSANEMSNNPSMQEVVDNHKAQIRYILMRAKEIDRRAKINTWKETSNLPTIVKVEDIPDKPSSLSAYLHKKGSQIQKGKNRNWQIKITTNITRQEFIHLWGLSKREYTRVPFVTLRSAPLQAPTYHAAGFFINSSDNQLVEQLEDEISKKIGHKIGIAYKPAAIVQRAARACWTAASKARQDAPTYEKERIFFRNAPMAMQVYAESRDEALKVAQKLSKEYGSVDKDRMYPRLPDGTRMRFVAAHVFLDMQGSTTAARLFQQQILLQKYEVTAPIPIRDPLQRFQSQQGKTMHELVMDLRDPESNNEPYFRNMRKKYHWNFKTKEWEVSMHPGMYQRGAKILRNFKEQMTAEYGEEVGDAIKDGSIEEYRNEYGSQNGATSNGISISTEDRYLNGDGHFIIIGIEKLEEHMKEKKRIERISGSEEDKTMNVRSTTSGMSGNTGNTVPSIMGINEANEEPGGVEPGGENGIKSESDTEGEYTIEDTVKPPKRNDSRGSGKTKTDEGQWKQVSPGKGAKPRPPTMSEKMLSMAASLSGFMGGGNT